MMKKIKLSITSVLLFLLPVCTMAGTLPVQEWAGSNDKPIILYISGDGGLNDFSKNLCAGIHANGYSVTALNARSYFWDKKTPEQTTLDIAVYLTKKLSERSNQQVILIGYSFGADVMPFIVNRLENSLAAKLQNVVLLSPSGSTDFEIHWSDLLGGGKKRSLDVLAEINRMKVNKLTTIFGSDENDFPVSQIKIEHHTNYILTGGHHYAGNTADLVKLLEKAFA